MKISGWQKKQSMGKAVPWIMLFLFWMFIMYFSPFSSDDYYWAAFPYENAGDMLEGVFSFGNGRLLGNVLVNVLVRSTVLRVLLKASILTSMIWMLPKVLKVRDQSTFMLVTILILAMDPELFGQVFVWTAGFCNFIPPIWITCVVLLIISKTERSAKYGGWCFLIFVLGFTGQFFVESNTIINVLIAVGYLGSGILEKRQVKDKNLMQRWVWVLSVLAGAGLMFLIPTLAGAAGRMDAYREVHVFGIMDLLKTAAANLIKMVYYFENNTILCMVIAGLTIVMLRRNQRMLPRDKRVLEMICTVSALFILCDGLFRESIWLGHFALVKLVAVFVPAMVLVSCLVVALFSLRVKSIYTLGALFLASIAPFLVISPLSKRCIMLGYIFLICMIICAWDKLMCDSKPEKTEKVRLGLTALICSLAVCLCVVFISIHSLDNMRSEHIRREVNAGAETIEIFRIPYRYVYWDEEWCFEHYYRNQEQVEIDFVVCEFLQWVANCG